MVEPGFHREIARYGGEDVTACMNCGSCTAVCSLSTESAAFPRRIIHLIQIGHRRKLAESLDPWLCYYCGDCSDTCPRDANPGETMMAARRYLTALYDWTGLGRKFYTSAAWEIGAMALVGAAVAVLIALFHGPVVTDRVALNTFAPVRWVEIGDWIMGGALALLLLTNARRMYRLVMDSGEGRKVPASLLLREARTFFVHLFTQKRWRDCEGQKTRRVKHLLLASGYATMLALVVVGLRWFQTDEIRPFWHPTRLLGYYATAVLLWFSADFLAGRWKRREPIHKSSEASDWIFLSLMFLVALTGILVHLFRLGGLPLPTYWTYAIHLVLVAPFLVVEVPFGKWSHMLYRPLAAWLDAVKRRAAESAAAADRAA
ncbi:MAG: 4Fe-4S dicluster domain-containing protein [Gemmatimonadota bacterium]